MKKKTQKIQIQRNISSRETKGSYRVLTGCDLSNLLTKRIMYINNKSKTETEIKKKSVLAKNRITKVQN